VSEGADAATFGFSFFGFSWASAGGSCFSSKSADKIKQLRIKSPISVRLHDVSLYRNLFRSYDRIRLTG
jgi:hypothetical protein